ncbi:unnamed protein product [Paramecium sonneborni]|uniref:Uncharacterized protein n=1 Tax=Paramecium sonneborni TaxID=65129 RepID=A0A8S1JZP3_9CILI|nr:unnamed protein product [Paramecium sonneborni]
MAILSFIESFITTTIDSFCYEQETKQFKNLSQLYSQLIRADQRYQNYLLVLETMLEECFQVFTYGDPFLIEFSKSKIYSQKSIQSLQYYRFVEIVFLIIKYNLFKYTLIYKEKSFSFQNNYYCNDYVNALVDIYNQIKSSILIEINEVNILKYVWDLIGIASEIDVDNIYRTFLRIIYPDLAKLLSQENIELFAKDYDSSIAIITLFKAIFYNKNTRLSTENIQFILYQIYGKAMKFFIILIQQQLQIAKTQQKISDLQSKQVSKLLSLMRQISGQKKKIIKDFSLFIMISVFQNFLIYKFNSIQLIDHYYYIYQNTKNYYMNVLIVCQDLSETLAYKCDLNSYLDIFLFVKNHQKIQFMIIKERILQMKIGQYQCQLEHY